MRNTILALLIVSLTITCSQQYTGENGTPLVPNSELAKQLNPQVGGPIAIDIAQKWILAFEKKYPASDVIKSHYISLQTIENLLDIVYADKALDGLRFIKGVNDKDAETLIVVPVQGGNDICYLSYLNSRARVTDTGTAYDINGPLPMQIAKRWVSAFKKNYSTSSGLHKSYFIGRETLKKLIAAINGKPIDGLRFYKALNESNKEAFIISPVQDGKTVGTLEYKIHGIGLRSTTDGEEYVFDLTSPCPNTCSQNSDLN